MTVDAESFSLSLTKFGANGYHVTVDAESFSQPIPKGLEASPEEVKSYATALWQEKAVNSVADALITGPAVG